MSNVTPLERPAVEIPMDIESRLLDIDKNLFDLRQTVAHLVTALYEFLERAEKLNARIDEVQGEIHETHAVACDVRRQYLEVQRSLDDAALMRAMVGAVEPPPDTNRRFPPSDPADTEPPAANGNGG